MIRLVSNVLPVMTCALVCVGFSCCTSGQDQPKNNQTDLEPAAKKTAVKELELQRFNANSAKAIDRAVKYLGQTQSADGAWHAEQYGAMKQGAAVTSIALYALSHLSDAELKQLRERGTIKKAAAFLKKGILRAGCVANEEGSLDFPVYSSALILTAHRKLDLGLTQQQTETLLDYLISSQCTQPRGFNPGNQNYGGWDILGPGATAGKSAGANVSVTFYVLEALTAYDYPKSKPSIERAKQWCERIVKSTNDGGFYFTSQLNSTLNKAGRLSSADQVPRSYGTATCDGLGIMLLTGAKQNSADVLSTMGWLKSHQSYMDVPGFPTDDETGWPQGLKFYYLAALTRSIDQFPGEHSAASRSISTNLIKLQNSNGSWQNETTLMREDEPLIATSFALIALANSKKQLSKAK